MNAGKTDKCWKPKLLFVLFLYTGSSIIFWQLGLQVTHKHETVTPLLENDRSEDAYNMTALDSDLDFTTLLNLTHFKFHILSRPCDGVKYLFIVVLVHSAPSHFNKRRAIRETWGNWTAGEGVQFRIIFLLGEVKSDELQEKIIHENYVHQDVVQGSFEDTYRNLTYKHLMGLKWVTYFCRTAKYIFKSDDDVFVNMPQLKIYLKTSYGAYGIRRLLLCQTVKHAYAKRSFRSKWRVSFEEYPEPYYPDYCSGWGIVYSPDVLFDLYTESSKVPYFWIDDVYVTGILASKIRIHPKHIDSSPVIKKYSFRYFFRGSDSLELPMFGIPESDISTIYRLWRKTTEYYNTSSTKR